MKKVLITGQHSFLGTSLKAYLEQFPECYQVDCISLRGNWRAASFQGYDAVYHTAAIVHQPNSKDDPAALEQYRNVNCDLAFETAQKAKAEGVTQFLFLSTMAVYGVDAAYGKTVTITAQTPTLPRDNYGISKLEAEKALLSLSDSRFHVVILRPPMIYGEGCKGNYRTLVALAEKLPCFPKVNNQRSMLYVGNLNRLVQLLIDREESGIFCPQDNDYVNTSAMVQAIAQARGKHIVLLPGFGWAMHLLRHVTGKVDKAFGSLCYDKALSAYKEDYCIVSFPESVK